MADDLHLSDEELQSAAAGQSNDLPLHRIESHLAECANCRSRLLDGVADEAWRDELVDGLQTAQARPADPKPATPSDRGRERQVHPAPVPSGDPFDLKTVDQMLQEVLEPAPDTRVLGCLGRYQVECVLGCGGMGVVLRGFDSELHRPVAIKLILPRHASRELAKERFLREARAAATVLHPNVVSIHDIDESRDMPWFIMPLVIGPSLRTLVDKNGPLEEQDIVRIGVQVASGLAAAHAKGLVHRDIKPENILVDNQVNRVVITDFGLAQRECEDAMTQTGWIAGSLHYMSPEQSRGEVVDGRSDLFSLGGVLYFLATGCPPFESSTATGVLHRIGAAKHPDVQQRNPEVSNMLTGIIGRLLAKSAQDRFPSAAAVELFLNEYLAHLHQPSQRPAPVIPAPPRKRGGVSARARWALALPLVTVLGVGLWAIGERVVALMGGGAPEELENPEDGTVQGAPGGLAPVMEVVPTVEERVHGGALSRESPDEPAGDR